MKKIAGKYYVIFKDWYMIFKVKKIVKETYSINVPVKYHHWIRQKFWGKDRSAYWPINKQSVVRAARNVYAGINVSPGYERGCYIQAINGIYIGDYTLIASNVGIISANHSLINIHQHEKAKPIIIGKYCWLGMNSVILPEVELGSFTIVGAGAIVTKSFKEGYCVVAGNPAKIIKKLLPEECIEYKSKDEYIGFYKKGKEFNNYANKYLNTDMVKLANELNEK